jgi:hypothetical protein
MTQEYLEGVVAACVVAADLGDFALQNVHNHVSWSVIFVGQVLQS